MTTERYIQSIVVTMQSYEQYTRIEIIKTLHFIQSHVVPLNFSFSDTFTQVSVWYQSLQEQCHRITRPPDYASCRTLYPRILRPPDIHSFIPVSLDYPRNCPHGYYILIINVPPLKAYFVFKIRSQPKVLLTDLSS